MALPKLLLLKHACTVSFAKDFKCIRWPHYSWLTKSTVTLTSFFVYSRHGETKEHPRSCTSPAHIVFLKIHKINKT